MNPSPFIMVALLGLQNEQPAITVMSLLLAWIGFNPNMDK